MKSITRLLTILLVSTIASVGAEPIDALLVVRNNDAEFMGSLADIGVGLSSALSGSQFAVIDPKDVAEEGIDTGVWGGGLATASAVRLAEACDAQVLLTATVDSSDTEDFGNPPVARRLSIKITLQAKRLPKGATIASADASGMTEKHLIDEYRRNEKKIKHDLVSSVVAEASERFLEACRGPLSRLPDTEGRVEVAFGCNLPGASLVVDGSSRGTLPSSGEAPLRLHFSPGLHRVEVELAGMETFRTQAKFEGGTTFLVVLRENEEGRARRMDDERFATAMDRLRESGKTDDAAKLVKAEGYGKYLSASHVRVEGMPDILDHSAFNLPEEPIR